MMIMINVHTSMNQDGLGRSGRGTQATRCPVLRGKWRQITPNQDPELNDHFPIRRAMSSTSWTHMGSGEGEGKGKEEWQGSWGGKKV